MAKPSVDTSAKKLVSKSAKQPRKLSPSKRRKL